MNPKAMRVTSANHFMKIRLEKGGNAATIGGKSTKIQL
jgi:hypothetical protein